MNNNAELLYFKQLHRGIHSTHPSYLLNRLIEQYKKQDRLVIAYDFDDTIRPHYCASCEEVKSVLRIAKQILNAYFIVYTCNPNHEMIEKHLTKEEVPFDVINQNAPFINTDLVDGNGKLFYNIFLDDKAGLGEVVNTLNELCYLVGNNKI